MYLDSKVLLCLEKYIQIAALNQWKKVTKSDIYSIVLWGDMVFVGLDQLYPYQVYFPDKQKHG